MRKVKLPVVFLSVLVLALMATTGSFAAEAKKWWPLDIFWVTDCPKDVGLAEKMEKGKVHYDQYTPPMKAKRPYNLGVLFPHLKDPWWVGCAYGLWEECKRLGLYATLLDAGGYDNLGKQISQLEDLASKGVDAILLAPISFEGMDHAVKKVEDQGIPIIEVINDIRTDAVVTKVGVSFYQVGYGCGQFVVDDVKKRGMKKAYTAFFPGPPGAGWSEFEWKGFSDAIKTSTIPIENLATKWGDTGKDIQLALIEDVLTTFGDKLDYLGGDAVPAGTAVLPIKQRGLQDKIKIVSGDISVYVTPYLKSGEIAAAISTQAADQYRVAVGLTVELLNGDRKREDFPDAIGAIVQTVTPENFDEFRLDAAVAPEGWRPVFNIKPD